MSKPSGKLIVIEGSDGVGKKTQFDLLKQRLELVNKPASVFDFPRYGQPAAHPVCKYLKKQEFGFTKGYGRAEDRGPHAISLLYALDRFDAAFDQENPPNMWDLLRAGRIVLCNRYTQSNIGHQASKIDDAQKRQEFIRWLLKMEYEDLKIPAPDLVLLLNMPADSAWELKQAQLVAEGRQPDAHEVNRQGLQKSHWAYLEAAKMFSDTWRIVNVVNKEDRRLLSRTEVHGLVWDEVCKVVSF